MSRISRREMLQSSAAGAALTTVAPSIVGADESAKDSLPMQLYKSLTDEQRAKVCLPADHQRRQFISNWWYIHPDYRVNNAFNNEQQELIRKIFDSLHNPDHKAAVNDQVEFDQYGEEKNAPAVGFFGTPADQNFEFIYTGHHVTRRCNAHSDKGHGFGGAPIFYGHFPEDFHESKDHPGNPYWYQGKIFNEFVQSLDGAQQAKALAETPRSEKPKSVVAMKPTGSPGLDCSDLSSDQQGLLLDAMKRMLVMFRADDVEATLQAIRDQKLVDDLHVSFYGGKYDIGSDKVWDTWQIEGPDMVWYFRGQPHIHSYFHLKT